MSRLPISPAFDRSAHTRRGLRIALAVGLGTLALGLAAGAFAASANQAFRIAKVRHVDSARATAPSALRAGDLFANPTMAPEAEADAPAPPPAGTMAHEASSETEDAQSPSIAHKNGVPPPSDDGPSDHRTGGPPSSPKPKPSHSPEPTPSPDE